MQKRKRIFMGIVAVILCLTLVSSCLVSGVFAKYATKTSAAGTISFTTMGVTVELDIDETKLEAIGASYSSAANHNESIGVCNLVLNNLQLKPGDDLSDVIKFTITGKPNVYCKVILDINCDFDPVDFYVPMHNTGGGYVMQYCMPLGFTFGYRSLTGATVTPKYKYYTDAYAVYGSDASYINPEALIYFGAYESSEMYYDFQYDPGFVITGVMDYYDYSGTDLAFEKVFAPSTTEDISFTSYDGAKINGFDFGFKWPEHTDYLGYDCDLIDTEFAKKGSSLNISYSIRVEQVTAEYHTDWYENTSDKWYTWAGY